MFRSIIPRKEVFFDNFEKICALMEVHSRRHLLDCISVHEFGNPTMFALNLQNVAILVPNPYDRTNDEISPQCDQRCA
jgi:hypothetical protein